MAWLSGWDYRKSLTLARAAGAVVDCQVRVVVHRSTGSDSGEDVYLGADGCASDYDDIRFTVADGQTLLDYWIEEADSASAAIWVEFDSIGTSATKFYLYYGNSGAAAVSDGDATFPLFDHFDGDLSGWTTGGAPGVADSILTLDASGELVRTPAAFGSGTALRARMYFSSQPTSGGNYLQCGDWSTTQSLSRFAEISGTGAFVASYDDAGTGETTSIDPIERDYRVYEIQRDAVTPSVIFVIDDVVQATHTTRVGTLDRYVGLVNASDTSIFADFVLVRKFYATAPEFGAWGEYEESESDFVDDAGLGDEITAQDYRGSVSGTIGLGDEIDAYDYYGHVDDGAGLGDTIDADAELQGGLPAADGLGDDIDAIDFYAEVAGDAGLADAWDRSAEISAAVSEQAGLGDDWSVLNWTHWLNANADRAVKRYYLTLTGAADGLADVELPMSSFQGRIRSGEPTYLAAVVPGTDYAAAITARSNGELVVEMAMLLDGEQSLREEIARVDLENIRPDYGGRNRSISLSGHTTETWAGKVVDIRGVSVYSKDKGKLRLRSESPDLYLRPGDTVRYDSESFTAALINYVVSVGSQYMEVSEA